MAIADAPQEVCPVASAPKGPNQHWFYYTEFVDPVFEGMVKEFTTFHETLAAIHAEVTVFLPCFDEFTAGLDCLSDSIVADFARVKDAHIRSDGFRFREATKRIIMPEARDSALAKLRRNLHFNVIGPLQLHLDNNEKLKTDLEKRERRVEELKDSKRQIDICVAHGLSESDQRYKLANQEFNVAVKSFRELDRRIFEWLYLLEEYKGDILDSCLQTLKYLQYDFFAMSAESVSSILPARMEFRPMLEMSPETLKAQVELEMEKNEDEENFALMHEGVGFAARVVERLERDTNEDDDIAVPVDLLSLSVLLGQGFDDAPARRALRKHRNDTQAAVDWLLDGGADDKPPTGDAATVRIPTAPDVARLRRLQEQRQRHEESIESRAPLSFPVSAEGRSSIEGSVEGSLIGASGVGRVGVYSRGGGSGATAREVDLL